MSALPFSHLREFTDLYAVSAMPFACGRMVGGQSRICREKVKPPVLLSIIVPAFNEANYLAATLAALNKAVEANREELGACEIIVCDNNSSDETAQIARDHGATVVFEPHNQISRARNCGAEVASGEWLLFVDADTIVSSESLADLLGHIKTGRYVAGGCAFRLDSGGRLAHFTLWLFVWIFRFARLAGGAFVFCRADAFRAVDGFSEEVYAGEEVFLVRELKRWGRARQLRFAFLTRHRVLTSGRKMQTHGLASFARIVIRGMIWPKSTIGSREHLGFFYDGKR